IAKPIIEVSYRKDGSADVQIKVANKNQLEWAKSILREDYSHLSVDESSFEKCQNGTYYVNSPICLRFGIGSNDFFRGACKSLFNLLGVNNHHVALLPDLDPI